MMFEAEKRRSFDDVELLVLLEVPTMKLAEMPARKTYDAVERK